MSAAVLDQRPDDDAQLVYVRERSPWRVRRELESRGQLGELLRVLTIQDDSISQLWLTPRWFKAHQAPDVDRAWLTVPLKNGLGVIVNPALNRRLEHVTHASGRELLEALELYSRVLHVRPGSPGGTAEMLLRGILARRDALAPLRAVDRLPRVVEPVLSWIRPLLPDEAAQAWLLAIDRRGAYRHSMALCDLGVGEPVFVEAQDWPALIWTPGYYRCRLKPWRELLLPDPIRCGRSDDELWLSAPAFRLAVDLDMIGEVVCAWIWPRRARVLRPIAERIAKGNAAFAQVDGRPARITVSLLKRTYVELVGRLRMESHRGTPLYRPDWRNAIVADSRERVYRTGALELVRAGLPPVACAIDCWYVPAPTVELPPGLEPKHWRLAAAVPLEALGEAFDHGSVRALHDRVLELAA